MIGINETRYLINSRLSNWTLVSAEIHLYSMSLNHFSGVFDEVEQLLWPNHTAHACCTGRVFKVNFLICQALMQSVVDILVSTVAYKCLTEQCAICNTTQLCNIYFKTGFFYMDTVHYHFEIMATQQFPNESDASLLFLRRTSLVF